MNDMNKFKYLLMFFASILSLLLSITLYEIQPHVYDLISLIFFLYMALISTSFAIYSFCIIKKIINYNKIIMWGLIGLYAFGVAISIFSVGLFYFPILVIFIWWSK